MLFPSWHVHRECAFLLAETRPSVSDWCVAEALVQRPPLESVLLDKSKSLPLQRLVLHLGLCLDRSLCGGIHGLDFHCRTENMLRLR